MQKRTTLFVLCVLFFNLCGNAQVAFLDGDKEPLLFPESIEEMPSSNPFTPNIHAPLYGGDEGGVIFSWEAVEVPIGCEVTYDLNIYKISDNISLDSLQKEPLPIFSVKTGQTTFIYGYELPPFTDGSEYKVIVNTYLKYPNHTEILEGKENAYVFEYIPLCTAPAKIKFSSVGIDNFEVSWSGPEASPSGVHYVLGYRPKGVSKTWRELEVSEGTQVSIEGLNNRYVYEVQVKKICPAIGDSRELHSNWSDIKEVVLSSTKSLVLPPFQCGATYEPEPCKGVSEVLQPKDTLFVGGFPILVDTMWMGMTNGQYPEWYGFGWVPLPFGDSLVVKVEWGGEASNLVRLDSFGVLCSGEVRGIKDDPSYWPNLDPGPIPFGGEICVPPPSAPGFGPDGNHSATGLPYDENGFGPNGTYDKDPPYPGYEPGDLIDTTGTYDPNGFDANGQHFTGGDTNEYGCTQEQLNSPYPISPCDSLPPPYYWLDPNGDAPNQEGNELANQVSDSLEVWINQILTELQTEYQVIIDTKELACDSIRDTMDIIIGGLGYERKFIFGENDVYFEQGMHTHFTDTPEPLSSNVSRAANQVQLEKKHIDLYHCDKDLYIYIHLLAILVDMKNNQIEDLVNEFRDAIEHFSAEQAALYSNPDSLYSWLEQEIKLRTNENYNDLYGFSDDYLDGWDESQWAAIKPVQYTVREKQALNFASHPDYNNYLASNIPDGELNQAFMQSMDFTKEDLSFQFMQGWKMINGVHRAYYLEAIANERKKAATQNTSFFTSHDNNLMPILLDNRGSDGNLYRVYLDDITFYTSQATLDAYILVELPHNGQRLLFVSENVKFGPTGVQGNDMKLNLPNDISIRLNNAAKLVIKGSENTFISVNCDGFAGIGIEAEVEICRNYVKPIDPISGAILPEPERVNGKILTFFPTWNDFYVEISMDPFVITNVEDVKWHIDQVVVDFSSTKSPDSLAAPPAGYYSPFAGPQGFQPQWKGFYMRNFSATLPEQFTNGNPITIGVENVLIDDLGFSGRVYAAGNILDLADGNAGGWAFSIDTISITIVGNQLQDAGLDGLIHVPIISNANDCNTGPATVSDCLHYDAFIEPGNIYHFNVSMPEEDYCIDMWKAGRVVLNENTSISMKLEGGDFDVLASLYGKVQINGEIVTGIGLNVSDIKFEKVEVSNKAPYFSPGIWKFPTTIGQDFGGFAFTISNLSMVQTEEGNPALKFGAEITIGNEEVPLSAKGGFRIIGERVEHNGRHRWKFKKAEINKVFIDGSLPGVKRIQGILEFFHGDATYGSGFRGGVGVTFNGLGGSVSALGHFGKKDDYKYFFVDAMVCTEVPIAPGVHITGFGGGVYYHMGRTTPGPSFSLPACMGDAIVPQTIGTSLSGINYSPNKDNLLGLKATVAMAAVKPTAFNANATFEISFKKTSGAIGFGIERVDFYGNAKLMAAPDKHASPEKSPDMNTPPNNNAPFKANISFTLDLENKIFSGDMVAFLNMPPAISGTGSGGRMTQTEMYFGPDKWYVRMGRPQNRNGLKVTIPGIKKPLFEIGSYFQVGSGGLDPMPDLPADIYKEFGLSKKFSSTINNRGGFVHNGGGFILGATANIDILDFNFKVAGFSVAKAELKAMLGFDVSVLDWGESAVCAGSGNTLGINGWYAQGQIYGGMKAALSVASIDLVDVQVAAALQARFPNPFWAKGGASVSIKVPPFGDQELNVNVEIGNKCEIVGVDNPLVETPIIEGVVPSNGMAGMAVETDPVVTFLMPMGEEFGLPELGDNSIYKPVLDHAKLLWHGEEIILEKSVWNEDMTELRMIPAYFLPSNDTLVLDVLVHVDSNGISIHTEHRLDTFSTGAGAQKIFEGNVVGSYPFDGQYNFYKKEISNKRGYIILDKAQPELFYDIEGYKDMKIRWKEGGGDVVFVHDLTHDPFEDKIEFRIPEELLANEQLYTVELVRIPKQDNSFGNGENNEGFSPLAVSMMAQSFGPSSPDINNYPINTNTPPPGNSSNPPPNNSQNDPADSTALENGYGSSAANEIIVCSINFRTSKYNTFNEKIADWTANRIVSVPGAAGNWPQQDTTGTGSSGSGSNIKGSDNTKTLTSVENYNIAWLALANETTMEPFDVFELKGYKGGAPLVDISAFPFLGDNPDYLPNLRERIYKYFPHASDHLTMNRDIEPYGKPPYKAMKVWQSTPPGSELKVTPDWVQSGGVPAWASEDRRVLFAYNVFTKHTSDYADFKSDALQWAESKIFQYFGEPCPFEDPCYCVEQAQGFFNTNNDPYDDLPDYIYNVLCGSTDYFPAPPPGDYTITVGYTLPGEDYPRSSQVSYITLNPY